MRYVSFGTAAAVVLATTGVLWFGNGHAVAFENVLQKVKQTESVTFVEKQKLGDQPEIEMKCAIRGPLARIEAVAGGITRQILIVDTKEKVGLMLIPQAKAYMKIDKDSPNKIRGPAGKSPIDDLLALKDRKPESTIEEKLDGKPVQKLTIKGDPKADPPGDWVIWVDPKTELPVKITYSGTTNVGKEVPITKTYERFTWNAKLDDKLFEMKVPKGYTVEERKEPKEPKEPKEKESAGEPTVFVRFVRPALDQAMKAETVAYSRTETRGKKNGAAPDVNKSTEYCRPGAARFETPFGAIIFTEGTLLVLDHTKKTYSTQRESGQPGSVSDVLAMFLAVKEGEDAKALGEEVVAGVATKKYESRGGKTGAEGAATATLWVDPKTGFPVKVHVVLADGAHTITFEKFRWNEKFDAKLFSLDPPAGYTPENK